MLGQESHFLASVWGCSYCLKKVKKTEFTRDCHFYQEELFVFQGKTENGDSYKVPHMGWNRLEWVNASPITANLEEDFAYFVHSYYVVTNKLKDVIAKASYYEDVPAVVGKQNVFGMQFHPEKSSQLGVELLRNFTRLASGKGE